MIGGQSPFGTPRGPILPSDPVIAPLPSAVRVDWEAARAYVRDESKPGWIEFRVVDDEGSPAAGERYRVRLPDGSVAEGRLGRDGLLRLDGIDPGECEVTFPDQHHDSWEKVEETS